MKAAAGLEGHAFNHHRSEETALRVKIQVGVGSIYQGTDRIRFGLHVKTCGSAIHNLKVARFTSGVN